MNKDVHVIRLEKRVSHLERKLVVWASRMKKEVIWRKFLEDWIMKKFNFDLRLQVELKTLEEDGVDEFEKDELSKIQHPINPPHPQSVFKRGNLNARAIPKASGSLSASGSSNMANLNSERSNISITVINGTTSENENSNVNSNIMATPLFTNNTNPSIRSSPVKPISLPWPSIQMSTPSSTTQSSFPKNNPKVTGISTSRSNVNPIDGNKTKKLRPMSSQHFSSPPHPIIISTKSIATESSFAPESPELILLDEEENSSSSTNRQQPTSSSNSCGVRQYDNNSGQLLESSSYNFSTPSDIISSVLNPDLMNECADSSNSEFSQDNLQFESFFASEGYLSRNTGLSPNLEFNIKKILQTQDPYITDIIINDILSSKTMSQTARKNITSAASDFLMKVYGENVPKTVKTAMAESLFKFFPFVPKETWWVKFPHKNPGGSLEHRINNKRRQLQDERKRNDTDSQSNVEGYFITSQVTSGFFNETNTGN